MATKKRKVFKVEGFIKAWTEIEVYAESLEQAVEVSRTLKTGDFIQFEGEAIDFAHEIVGVRGNIPDVNE
jgi:hypothetical protein